MTKKKVFPKKVVPYFLIVLIPLIFIALSSFGESLITAKVVVDTDLCGNGLVDENETCFSCSKDVAVAEICDGIDNDCDQLIDESNVCNTVDDCGSFGDSCVSDESCNYGVCGEPLVFLRFDEKKGNVAFDSSGNNHYGTLVRSAEFVNASHCLFNGCVDLGTLNDYINFSEKPVGDIFKDQFTISFWARSSSYPDRPTLGFANSSNSWKKNPFAFYDRGINIGKGSDDLSEYQLLEYFYPNAPVHLWRHFAFVDNGSMYLAYVDGKLRYEEEITIDPGSGESREFLLGQSGFEKQHEDNFKGYLDEFMIYDRALSTKEIENVHYSGQD